VSTVLESPTLNPQWYGECKAMADRIIEARGALRGHLESIGSVHNWQHITNQIGMVCLFFFFFFLFFSLFFAPIR
jgi:aspartate aminotransferase